MILTLILYLVLHSDALNDDAIDDVLGEVDLGFDGLDDGDDEDDAGDCGQVVCRQKEG